MSCSGEEQDRRKTARPTDIPDLPCKEEWSFYNSITIINKPVTEEVLIVGLRSHRTTRLKWNIEGPILYFK
jgi:hypothetical protein